MLALIVFLVVVLALIALFVVVMISKHNLKRLCHIFDLHSTATFGVKGNGKDMLFQAVINARHSRYYSSLDYGGLCSLVNLRDLSLAPNTFLSMINGERSPVVLPFYEHADFYLSDVGVFLPCQYDSQLSKLYPSFSLFYALTRHVLDSNVHYNTQSLSRPWKILREQCDYYIHARGCVKLPFCFLVKFTAYSSLASADACLEPMSKSFGNKFQRGEFALYKAQHGDIFKSWFFISKKNVHYDTRFFKSYFPVTNLGVSDKTSRRQFARKPTRPH